MEQATVIFKGELSVPGRGNSKYNHSKVGIWLWNSKEASVTGTEWDGESVDIASQKLGGGQLYKAL